jgi:pSer/pThr/pTyr-binding forkhead associated (FHA) protein
MWKLVIEDDEARRTVVPLSRDAYDVGRAEENAIRLTERNVSRRHARLERRAGTDGGEAYRLEDLASLTGVYVNGVRLEEPVELVHGDLVVIGDYRIAVENEAAGPVAHEPTNPELKVTRREQPKAAPFRLLAVSGPDAGKVFPLGAGRTILGRAEDATIQLTHPSVSRHHAEVVVLPDGRLELVDSGSSNGLVLNGKTIRREILEGGDLFELGDVRIRVLEPGAPVPQLAAAESAGADAERPRTWLPALAFGLVVVIGGAAIYLARQPSTLPSGGSVDSVAPPVEATPEASAITEPPAAQPIRPETAPLEEALALCKRQECDRARELLEARLPANDPSLDGPAGKAFFHDWAIDLVARAKSETDVDLKRELLDRVRLEIHTPPSDRERAKRALDALASAKPSSATSTSTEPTSRRDAGAAGAEKSAKTDAEKGTKASAAEKPAKSAPSARTEDPDKIRAWMMGTDAEKKLARDYLYGRFQRGQASRDELKGLQGLCKDLGDAKCVEEVKSARNQEAAR